MALPRAHRISGSSATTEQLRAARPHRHGPFVLRVIPVQGEWRIAVTIPARVIATATARNATKRKLHHILGELSLRAGWVGTLSVQRNPGMKDEETRQHIRALCIESGILQQ